MSERGAAESNLDIVLHILGTAYEALDSIALTRDPDTAEALRQSARSLHDAALKFALMAGLDEPQRRMFNATVAALEQKMAAAGAWPAGRKG